MMTRRRWLKVFTVFALVGLLLVTFTGPALAFTAQGGEDVVINEDVNDDLYVGANTITINAVIKGDLVAAGSVVTIGPNGKVEGDLLAVGQSVIIQGQVLDDARAAGTLVRLEGRASVGDDLVAAGAAIETRPETQIAGTAVLVCGQGLLAGVVAEDLKFSGGGLELNGQVTGDVSADVGEPSNVPPGISPWQSVPNLPADMPAVKGGLILGPEAKIGGRLDYTAEKDANIPAGAVAGEVVRTEPGKTELSDGTVVTIPQPTLLERVADYFRTQLGNLMALLLLGLLFAWALPALLKAGADKLQAKPLPSLGWGFLSVFIFIFAMLVLILAIILVAVLVGVLTLGRLLSTVVLAGSWVGSGAWLVFVMTFGYFTKLIVGYLVARWLLSKLKPDLAQNVFVTVIIGALLVALVEAIPIGGGLVGLILTLFGLGALWLLGREWLQRRKAAAAPKLPAEPTPLTQ
jgi:cytoskeletal protein CcmA (bactofilin family)